MADLSISMVCWTVLHCFSLIVNVRIPINVLSPFAMDTMGLTSSLQVTASCFLYHKTQNKNKTTKLKNIYFLNNNKIKNNEFSFFIVLNKKEN